jgi:hypothetical protein
MQRWLQKLSTAEIFVPRASCSAESAAMSWIAAQPRRHLIPRINVLWRPMTMTSLRCVVRQVLRRGEKVDAHGRTGGNSNVNPELRSSLGDRGIGIL